MLSKQMFLTLGFMVGVAQAGGQAGEDAQEFYNSGTSPTCASCHNSGAAGAPRVGEAEDWADRSEDVDALLTTTLEGKAAMPAYEGRANEAELRAAIQYMLSTMQED